MGACEHSSNNYNNYIFDSLYAAISDQLELLHGKKVYIMSSTE